MCLSLLSNSETPVVCSFIGESVSLRVTDGKLQASEIYDVFFTLTGDAKNSTILCVSPHDLFANGSLTVTASATPGLGGDEDMMYKKPLGCGCSFNHKTREFSVTIRGTSKRQALLTESFSAETIVPQIGIPSQVENKKARAVLEKIGTIFELRLPQLVSGKLYAIRLLVEPQKLLGLPELTKIDLESKHPVEWMQHASLICPTTSHYNVCDMLKQAQSLEPLRKDSTGVLSIIDAQELRIINPELHRILLLFPPGCEMGASDQVGCVWCSANHPLADNSLAVEWTSGTKHYWTDDPECVARRIWEYLFNWSKGNPKPTEFLTTALGIPHDNCSLIVNALVYYGALKIVDQTHGLFGAVELTGADQRRIFRAVAVNPSVKDNFMWMGFEVRYRIRFRYLSEIARKHVKWVTETRPKIAFILSITGICIGLASLLLRFLWK